MRLRTHINVDSLSAYGTPPSTRMSALVIGQLAHVRFSQDYGRASQYDISLEFDRA